MSILETQLAPSELPHALAALEAFPNFIARWKPVARWSNARKRGALPRGAQLIAHQQLISLADRQRLPKQVLELPEIARIGPLQEHLDELAAHPWLARGGIGIFKESRNVSLLGHCAAQQVTGKKRDVL